MASRDSGRFSRMAISEECRLIMITVIEANCLLNSMKNTGLPKVMLLPEKSNQKLTVL